MSSNEDGSLIMEQLSFNFEDDSLYDVGKCEKVMKF